MLKFGNMQYIYDEQTFPKLSGSSNYLAKLINNTQSFSPSNFGCDLSTDIELFTSSRLKFILLSPSSNNPLTGIMWWLYRQIASYSYPIVVTFV